MMNSTPRRVFTVLVPAFFLWGCPDYDNPGTPLAAPDVSDSYFAGGGVGESCEEPDDCRDGLLCDSNACLPSGEGLANEKCLLTAECSDGLHCGWAGFCVPEGDGVVGDQCAAAMDCNRGLYCALQALGGYCAEPTPDAGDLGAACSDTSDCLAGLACSLNDGACAPGSVLLTQALFKGATCPDGEEALPFGVRMATPETEHGFYSIPYPNNVHLVDGRVDLSRHPRPGPGLAGFDTIGALLDGVSSDMTGFSVNPAVYFRFTRAVDPATLRLDGIDPTIVVINLDSGQVETRPFFVRFVTKRNKYICENHMVLHPVWGHALPGDTTYGVIVTDGVRSLVEEGFEAETPVPLDDLSMLLGDEEPDEAREAWQAYAPLRSYLASSSSPAMERIVGATVFTTQDPHRTSAALRSMVRAQDASEFHVLNDQFVVCSEAGTSPCKTPNWQNTVAGQEGLPDPRDCPATGSPLYHEVHAQLRVPRIQAGDRPYLEDGGNLVFENGEPVLQGWDTVCLAMAIPKAPMPSAGWPVLMYGHGTDGSFRKGLQFMATPLSMIEVNGGIEHMAVVGLDQPMHGNRRGAAGADKGPGPLFYNYRNPPAARGNNYQAVVDNYALIRFLETADVNIGSIGAVRFDTSRVGYHGHSQGGASGVLIGPNEPVIGAMTLSGTGGSLVYSMLGKAQPYDTSVAIRIAAHEVEMDANHPVLHLIQHYFDETDPAVHAARFANPPSGVPTNVLDVFGRADTFTPPEAIEVMASSLAGDLALSAGSETDMNQVAEIRPTSVASLPLANNRTVAGQPVTHAVIEHSNPLLDDVTSQDANTDGHFVFIKNEKAVLQIQQFFGTWLSSGTATVVE